MSNRIIKREALSTEQYRALPGVNFSTLKAMARSPMHYQYALKNPKATTAAMLLGTAIHTACLEPERFMLDYAMFDGERRQGKAWESFVEAHDGKVILKREEYMVAIAAMKAVRAHPYASQLIARGEVESTLVWKDQETGAVCKGRPDHIGWPATIVDLKSTNDASHFAFSRLSYQMMHHVQLAYYADGYELITGMEPRVLVVAVEQAAPHDVVVYTVDEDVLAIGRETYRAWLAKYLECSESGSWPGYCPDGPMPLQLPAYAVTQEDGDLEALGLEM